MKTNLLCLFLIIGCFLSCSSSNDEITPDEPETPVTPEKPGGEETPGEPDVPAQDTVYHIRFAENYKDYLPDAERWPGLVGDSLREKRLDNVKVTIDARYNTRHPNDRLGSIGNTPWFSTGLYAAPGEIITVIRPKALSGKNINIRINASNCDLKNYNGTKNRADKIWVQATMIGDTMDIVNYYGGNIYIIPDGPLDAKATFTITGAVKSPDFVSGVTDPEAWRTAIQKTTVPMAEIEGKRMIFTFPTKYLKNLTNPKELMDFYDDAVINTFNRFNGLTDDATDPLHRSPSFKHRGVADINTCAGAAHAGYPLMFGEGMNYAARFIQLELMKNEGGAWGYFHELGHNYQTWVWKWDDGPGSIGEVSNNLYIMYDRNRRGTWPEQTANWGDMIENFVKKDDPDKNFDEGQEGSMIPSGKGSRIVPFAQLAQKFGWKIFTYLCNRAREMNNTDANSLTKDMGRREFFCKRVCEFAQADMRPFFDAWGIKYGPVANAEMSAMPPYTGEAFWLEWNPAIIGSVENLSQADFDRIKKKLPDNTYNDILGEISRDSWSISAEGGIWEYDKLGGHPSKVIDNDLSSCIMWVKPGKTYSSKIDGVTQSVKGTDPMTMTIDMKKQETFNYFYLRHRSDGLANPGFNVVEATLYGSNNGTTFEEIEIVPIEFTDGGDKITLKKTSNYRYVKFKVSKWNQNPNYTVCIADFKLGFEEQN